MSKKLVNNKLPRYSFVAEPSDGAVIVPASGHFLSSAFVAAINGLSNQAVVDKIMGAVPSSFFHDLVLVTGDGLSIHHSLLCCFGDATFNSARGVLQ